MIVRVGTANPMKLAATRKAFAKFFKKVKVVGVETPSAVSPQPISFGEIVRGARERARAAFRECDFSVGIEAGSFRVAAVAPHPFQITMARVFELRTFIIVTCGSSLPGDRKKSKRIANPLIYREMPPFCR